LGLKENDNTRQKKELKIKYENGELTRLQYVKRMAFTCYIVFYTGAIHYRDIFKIVITATK
jgi:hypothetical protein